MFGAQQKCFPLGLPVHFHSGKGTHPLSSALPQQLSGSTPPFAAAPAATGEAGPVPFLLFPGTGTEVCAAALIHSLISGDIAEVFDELSSL